MSRRGLARHNPKRDAVEPEVIAAFEAHGWIVERLSGKGVPDLLCWKLERILLVECKSKRGTATKAQRAWKGPPPITLRSQDEAVEFLRTGGVREA